jgi:hypothetical protein
MSLHAQSQVHQKLGRGVGFSRFPRLAGDEENRNGSRRTLP